MEDVPIHPVHGVQDWDAPAGAISWKRLVNTLRTIKETGKIPPEHRSHDHLNEQKDFPVDPEVEAKLVAQLKQAQEDVQKRTGKKIIFGILDGFLLYWHPVSILFVMAKCGRSHSPVRQDVIAQLDIPIMLRVPEDVLKKRRTERHGYHTAGMLSLITSNESDFHAHSPPSPSPFPRPSLLLWCASRSNLASSCPLIPFSLSSSIRYGRRGSLARSSWLLGRYCLASLRRGTQRPVCQWGCRERSIIRGEGSKPRLARDAANVNERGG